jgi:hypothetical protein
MKTTENYINNTKILNSRNAIPAHAIFIRIHTTLRERVTLTISPVKQRRRKRNSLYGANGESEKRRVPEPENLALEMTEPDDRSLPKPNGF